MMVRSFTYQYICKVYSRAVALKFDEGMVKALSLAVR